MMKEFAAVSLVGILCCTAMGQTQNDFNKKYMRRQFYEIRPKILMSAVFDKSGQVCRVLFQVNSVSERTKTAYLGQDGLDLEEVKEAFDEIVPTELRQGKLDSHGGFMLSGGMFWGTLDYENISIGVKGAWQGSKPRSEMDFCKVFGNALGADEKLSFCKMYGSLNVVSVHWTKRDCLEN